MYTLFHHKTKELGDFKHSGTTDRDGGLVAFLQLVWF